MGKRMERWKRLIMKQLRKASKEKEGRKKEKEPEPEQEKEREEAQKEEKAEKEEKEEQEKEKEDKEKQDGSKEAAKEAKKEEKEAEEKEAEGKEAEGKEAEEKDSKEQKEQKTEGKKAKKGKNGRNLKEDPKTEAMEEDQELAGDILKHMLEYEQTNEKPENRVLNELVSSGKTDDLVKILSAEDTFRADHQQTAVSSDGKTHKTATVNAGKSDSSPIAQTLTDSLELARENEKETKIMEEQREKLGYQDLLAMEAPFRPGKGPAKRVIRRPVKELKLPPQAAENKPMEPPPMGPKLPSRRKKKEQDD